MRCKLAEKSLLAYIEGTLRPRQKDRLEYHLGKCPHCQKVLVAFEKTLQLAGSLPVKYPSSEVWESFWPKLRSKISQGTPIEDRAWHRAHKWKIACVAGMLAATLSFAGLWIFGLFKIPTVDESPSLDERIVQNFMGGISAKHLRELLNQELQRLDGTSLTWSGENLLMEETGFGQSTESNSLVSQLFEVVATEVDLEYFEDDELTDLVDSMESRLTLVSVR